MVCGRSIRRWERCKRISTEQGNPSGNARKRRDTGGNPAKYPRNAGQRKDTIPFAAPIRSLKQEFDELTQPEYGLGILRKLLGVDLDGVKLDEPFPPELLASAGRAGSRSLLLVDVIRRERPTVRQLLHRFAGARGHYVFAGTPVQVADEIQRWFEDGAADGFNIMPPWLPGGFEAFADDVVPILQSRGLFRTEYSGRTLREHFGLDRPESQYSQHSQPQDTQQLTGAHA